MVLRSGVHVVMMMIMMWRIGYYDTHRVVIKGKGPSDMFLGDTWQERWAITLVKCYMADQTDMGDICTRKKGGGRNDEDGKKIVDEENDIHLLHIFFKMLHCKYYTRGMCFIIIIIVVKSLNIFSFLFMNYKQCLCVTCCKSEFIERWFFFLSFFGLCHIYLQAIFSQFLKKS